MIGVDHTEQALANLPRRLHRPRWLAFVRTICRQIQELDDALVAIGNSLNLDNAQGVLVDAIGDIVLQPRATTDDEVYKRRIRARIAANRARGLTSDLMRMAELVINDDLAGVTIEHLGATAVLSVRSMPINDSMAGDLANAGKRAVSAGVRLLLHSTPAADASTFALGYIPAVFDEGWAAGDTIIAIDATGTDDWPREGICQIYGGLFSGEVFAYRFYTPTALAFAPALPFASAAGEEIHVLVEGLGLGSSTESGQPCLTPYTSPGTTGGALSDIR